MRHSLSKPKALYASTLLASLSLLPLAAQASNYYVATTGSDSNPCTQASPCATINNAVNKHAHAGDSVIVEPGTYAQTVSITASGSSSAGLITIQSQTRWGAVIAPSSAQLSSSSNIFWGINSSYIRVDGFEINGTASGGSAHQGITGYYPNTHIAVTHNKIHHWGHTDCSGGAGVNLHTGSSLVDSNFIYDYGNGTCTDWDGIYIGDGDNTVVTNNIVGYATSGTVTGIQLNGEQAKTADYPSHMTVANNTIFNISGYGILEACWNIPAAHTCTGNETNNNIIYGITRDQLGHQESVRTADAGGTFDTTNIYSNNLSFGGGSPSMASGQSLTNTVTSTPLFVNYQANATGNYELESTSPAIMKGTQKGAPATDFLGAKQTYPATIGAYSYPN